MSNSNPLLMYFRTEKITISLPSGTSYYDPSIITFNDDGEIGIMSMTAKDELSLQNPDALLNGNAVVDVVSSCVPAIKNVKAILANDIDAILVAIRFATYGESMDLKLDCPKCKKENSYSLNLSENIENMGKLDSEYVVNLSNGLSVFLRPFRYNETLLALRAQFEQSKISRSIQDPLLSDEQRIAMFNKSFNEIANLNFKLIALCIIKIVNEANNILVTDQKQISEFIANVEKSSISLIDAQIKIINDIGINKEFTAICQHVDCKHNWIAPVNFNPVNFFSGS